MDHTNLKIIDFGLAKPLYFQGASMVSLVESSLGALHGPPGTVTHFSPEVARGALEYYNEPARDIWACGVILYNIVTFRLPFYMDNPTVFGLLHLIGNPSIKMSPISEDCSTILLDLISKLLDKNRDIRIQTIEQLEQHAWFFQ